MFFLDESRRLRTAWRLAIFLICLVVLQLAIGIALGVAIAVYALATGADADEIDRQIESPWVQIAGSVALAPFLIGLVLLCRRFLDRRPVASVGLGRPGARAWAALALGLAAGTLPVATAIGLGGYRFVGASASAQTFVLLPVLALAAFQEEIVCRGYLLRNMMDVGRPAAGVIFSSAVFWLLHALNPSAWSSPLITVNLLGAGVVFALAYRASGELWVPTALHWGWNVGQGVLFQAPISGMQMDGLLDVERTAEHPAWLVGGAFGLESSLLMAAIEAVLIGLFAWMLVRRNAPPISDRPSASPEAP